MAPASVLRDVVEDSEKGPKIEHVFTHVQQNGVGLVLDHRLYIPPDRVNGDGVPEWDDDYRFGSLSNPAMLFRTRQAGYQAALDPKGREITIGRTAKSQGLQLLKRPRKASEEREQMKVTRALELAGKSKATVVAALESTKAGVPQSLVTAKETVTRL
jgi:hypothetical protein